MVGGLVSVKLLPSSFWIARQGRKKAGKENVRHENENFLSPQDSTEIIKQVLSPHRLLGRMIRTAENDGQSKFFLPDSNFLVNLLMRVLYAAAEEGRLVPACNVFFFSLGVERVGKQASLPRSRFCCLSWLNPSNVNGKKAIAVQQQPSPRIIRNLCPNLCHALSWTNHLPTKPDF